MFYLKKSTVDTYIFYSKSRKPPKYIMWKAILDCAMSNNKNNVK